MPSLPLTSTTADVAGDGGSEGAACAEDTGDNAIPLAGRFPGRSTTSTRLVGSTTAVTGERLIALFDSRRPHNCETGCLDRKFTAF